MAAGAADAHSLVEECDVDGLTASRKDTVEPVAAPRAGTPFAISEDSVSEGSVHPVLLQKLPAAPPKMSMSVPPSMQRRQSVMSQGMNPARQRWNTAIQAVSTIKIKNKLF